MVGNQDNAFLAHVKCAYKDASAARPRTSSRRRPCRGERFRQMRSHAQFDWHLSPAPMAAGLFMSPFGGRLASEVCGRLLCGYGTRSNVW